MTQSIKDDSIEGLLEHLKKTLEVEEKNESIKMEEVPIVENSPMNKSDPSVFFLRKSFEKKSHIKTDGLKEQVLKYLENEVSCFVKAFMSSDEGLEYIRRCLSDMICAQEKDLKSLFQDEIEKKLQELFSK